MRNCIGAWLHSASIPHFVSGLFFARLPVAIHELVHATGCIDELRLTSVERVRGAGDFELYYGISFTFKLDSVSRLASRTGKEHVAIAHVFENDRAIILGMNTFFHFCYLLINLLLIDCW